MSNRTIAITVFVLLCIACVAHALYFYPRLPEHVAQHFDVSGQPDAWGSRTYSLIAYLVTVGVVATTFLGFGLAVPLLPNGVINLPNKDYWLAPERRQHTLDYILSMLLWLGSFTMILLLDIFHQSFQVTLGKASELEHFWITMGAYLTVTALWCALIYVKFRAKKT